MRRTLTIVAVAAALAVSAGAQPSAAAGGTDGAFNFRLGGFFPSGDGDFWEANEAAFTIDHSDFDGLTWGVSYVASINNYVEFGVGMDFFAETARSADRAYEDQFGNPILHDTRLSIVPVTADLRVLPGGRFKHRGPDGRTLVRRPVPYLGAGIGLDYWQYEEEGDFVASDLSIVYDRLTASGLAFETHVMIGVELPLSPRWYLTFEARQSWAEDTPGGSFSTVNPGTLDLGGTMVLVGGSLRF